MKHKTYLFIWGQAEQCLADVAWIVAEEETGHSSLHRVWVQGVCFIKPQTCCWRAAARSESLAGETGTRHTYSVKTACYTWNTEVFSFFFRKSSLDQTSYRRWRHWRCVSTPERRLWTTSVNNSSFTDAFILLIRIRGSQNLTFTLWGTVTWCEVTGLCLDYDYLRNMMNVSVFCRLVSQESTCPNLHGWKWTTVWSRLCGTTQDALLHPYSYNSSKPCMTLLHKESGWWLWYQACCPSKFIKAKLCRSSKTKNKQNSWKINIQKINMLWNIII